MNGARAPWLAGLMAAFCAGFGHLHAGRWRAAIAIPLALRGAMSAALVGVLLAGGSALQALGAAACSGGGLWLIQIVAAVRVSTLPRRSPAPPLAVYLVFVALVQAGSLVPSMALRAEVLEGFKIPSDSMQPTLRPGDFVAIPKIGPRALSEPAPWCSRAPTARTSATSGGSSASTATRCASRSTGSSPA